MGLPRTFVGFSSTDIDYYRMMQAWKVREHIDFNFTDCQLHSSINSENESYIKRLCRERIDMAGTFLQLIGKDTRTKHTFVRWELEVAIEKKCRLIAVNIDNSRRVNPDTCPPLLRNKGAVFVSYNARIIQKALAEFQQPTDGDWHYSDEIYKGLGL